MQRLAIAIQIAITIYLIPVIVLIVIVGLVGITVESSNHFAKAKFRQL
jgi:hypothetical protein